MAYEDQYGFRLDTKYWQDSRKYNLGRFSGLGGAWEDWCDGKFGNDPINLAKCKSQPMGMLTLAPWTDVGAIQRGIPKPSSLLVSAVTGATSSVPDPITSVNADGSQPSAGDADAQGLFGVPKTVLLVGGGVLALGVVALAMKGKKRSLAGYRRRRRSRR